MTVWNAMGIALFIVVLKFLAPAVLSQGISTTVSVLRGVDVSAQVASSYAARSAALGTPSQPPFPLPQARQITPIR